MAVWAIADLHLSFGIPNKKMDIFGPQWVNHPEKIAAHWQALIKKEDLVLVAGDISWALHAAEVKADLDWIEALPGTKVFIKGNHDYWWQSLNKVKSLLPPSCHALQNTAFLWQGIAIGGTRLWDCTEYGFAPYINYQLKENISAPPPLNEEDKRIFTRELHRLELSLKELNKEAAVKIVMTHYPPIGAELHPSSVSQLLEKYGISYALFGHLHNVKKEAAIFGKARGIEYKLTSCDYLDFCPIQIL